MKRVVYNYVLFSLLSGSAAAQQSPNRITNSIESGRTRAIQGFVHRLAQPQYDRGAVSPEMAVDHVQIFIQPTVAQQSELDALLRDQQNPGSKNYRQWLTPAQFAGRFGLSPRDHAKVIAWLKAEGLNVQESSSGRNWVSFAGSAEQISQALHTSIHSYAVNGETHFANTTDPRVPEAIADLVAGFAGLNDFHPKSNAVLGPKPDFNSGANHYLSPGDFSTIYNTKALYAAGIDGTGQSIAVVGESDIAITDISGFRSDFSLPVNNPKLLLYGTDPGFNGAQIEANLDLEWSGAIAQKATVYYVYGQNAFTAWSFAVSQNVAPVVSISYGTCESDFAVNVWRAVAQQGNAQGITTLVASGDSGGAGCDIQGDLAFATHGKSVQFPGDVPEVTAVGGTMFQEGTGSYWSGTNSLTGTALSYIPEVAWNETSAASGLGAGGGGASKLFSKPDWQSGPGVPNDGARDVPDVSFSAAANHDGYLLTFGGASNLFVVGGTSASAPSMAGIVALLNQAVVKQGLQKTAGLGNINPQLYRLAQAAPAVFHDITSGGNIVPCEQGTADCQTGSVGYASGVAYDQATGLGSLDANALVNSWNVAVSGSTVSLSLSTPKVTINDTVTLTATVASATGKGTPTGTVTFLAFGNTLSSGVLSTTGGAQMVSATFPSWMLAVGMNSIYAAYAGDAAFSGSGASVKVQVTLPTTTGTAAITASVPGPVYAVKSGTQAPTWQASITLAELAGVPALLTGFTIDGAAQTLSATFPSVNIPASGTLTASFVLRGQAVPVIHIFGFTGTDVGGNQWSRQVSVPFVGPVKEQQLNFNLWANPLTMQQNTAAPANCQWSQQVTLDETTGYAQRIMAMARGSVDISSSIVAVFGTTRLAAWGSLSGTVCWANVVPPATDLLLIETADDFGDLIIQEANVNFAGPAAVMSQLSASPAAISLKSPTVPGFPTVGTLGVNVTGSAQAWTATVYPATAATSWLQLSQYSGTGAGLINLQVSGVGIGPGVYRATIVVQSPLATPEWISIPVMFVNGPAGPVITSANNALSGASVVASGALMAVYGTQLASATQTATLLPLTGSLGGVSATVNGWPAPLLYVSPTQINLQVPFEAGTGVATVGINNNGQVAGLMVPVAQASPAILGTVVSAKSGGYATIYVTGTGDLNQSVPDGATVGVGTPVASLPLPLLPISVTVGGVSALIQFAGMPPGVVGLIQVNFVVPSGVAVGMQPVVITAGGVQSVPYMMTVM